MAYGGGNNRRRSGGALYVTLAGAFLLLSVITAMGLFFKITVITVVGAGKYSPEEIIAASGIETDTSIFFLRRGAAQIGIKEKLPYVDEVRIQTNLPGSVTIQVTESVPVAYFTAEGSEWIIDEKGRILEETGTAGAEGLIALRGVTVLSPEVGKTLDLGPGETVRRSYLLDTLGALYEAGLAPDTQWLDMSSVGAVTFSCRGYNVNIKQTDNLEGKFSALLEFYRDHGEWGSGQELTYDESVNGLRYTP